MKKIFWILALVGSIISILVSLWIIPVGYGFGEKIVILSILASIMTIIFERRKWIRITPVFSILFCIIAWVFLHMKIPLWN